MQSIPQILMSFQADLTSRTDYYPFGMEIQSRSGNYTNIDYSADVNKLLYSGLLSKCNNYEAIIQNPQPGLNVLINCQTAQNVYGQDYVDALQIEDHTGGLNFDLNMNINLSEIIPSLESDGDYVIELSMLGTHEREVTAHIGGVLGVISSPSHPDGGNLIPADDKVVTFSLKGSDLQALATNNQILLNLTFIFHGSADIIELQNLKVFQIFEGYSVPLAKRLEKGYRYGFQNQERDDEIAGSGNSYTAKFWQYDSRLGRRWNLDPKPNPSISQYATFANNPIFYTDILGDTINVGASTKANKGFQKWKNSKAGKKFYKRYGIGGKRENVNVDINFVDAVTTFEGTEYSASGLTETFVDGSKGRRSLISQKTYDKMSADGKDMSKYTTSIGKGENIGFNIQYTGSGNSVDEGATLLHETQHVRIGDYAFKMYGKPLLYNSTDQHIMMLNNFSSPGLYTKQNKPRWTLQNGNRIYDFNAERWGYFNQYRSPNQSNADIDRKAYDSGESNLFMLER